MVVRRALLIAVPNAVGQREIPGTKQDLASLSSFLQSVSGGYWHGIHNSGSQTEVGELLNPTRQEVIRSVGFTSGADIAIVLFSGHGCERQRSNGTTYTSMLCADGQEVSIDELSPSALRSLLFLDCCRNLEREKVAVAKDARLGAILEQTRSRVDPVHARNIYDKSVLNADAGTIVVYGCKFKQSASDTYSFTRAMVDVSAAWSAESSLSQNGLFDLRKSFLTAKSWHERREGNQKPEMVFRGNPPFPKPEKLLFSIPEYL